MSFEERARTHGEGRAMQDGTTLAVLVCIPGIAVKPLTLGVELKKLIYAWICRHFLLLFFSNSFVIYFICHLLTYMWKSRALWVNFRKSTKFDSLRRELFFFHPCPSLDSQFSLTPHHHTLKHLHSPHLSVVPWTFLPPLPSGICQLWRARSYFFADHSWCW